MYQCSTLGEYEYLRLPMGLCNAPDIFQEKIADLMQDFGFVRTYIDDVLVFSTGSYEDHLEIIPPNKLIASTLARYTFPGCNACLYEHYTYA